MTWTQERISAGLTDLDVPVANDAFWERLRAELQTREPDLDDISFMSSPSDQPMARVQTVIRSRPRLRWSVAAAAACALLITGLYVVGRGQDQTSVAGPSSADVVFTDPLSLSLDDLPRTGETPVSPTGYLVVDLAELPEGWTATLRSAIFVAPPDNGYHLDYTLWSPTGRQYPVIVITGENSLAGRDGDSVDINGHAGAQDHLGVTWEQEPGVNVGVSPTELNFVGAFEELTAAGRSLTFKSVREFPVVPIDPDAVPPTEGAQFAGTLNGVRYAVRANTETLRGIRAYVGDEDNTAGLQEDRSSQPTDDPETSGRTNIMGVPGYGVIVFGYTAPTVAVLRADLADGSTIEVPVLRNPGETYYALPIPLGVEVVALELLDVTHHVISTATMPSLPPYFGGSYGPLTWNAPSLDGSSTDDSSATPTTLTRSNPEVSTSHPLYLASEPAGLQVVGQGVRPVGGEDVRAAVFIKRDAQGTIVDRVIARVGDISLYAAGDDQFVAPPNLAPATSGGIVVDPQGQTVYVQYALGPLGNLTLEAYHVDELTNGALSDEMQQIAATLDVAGGDDISVIAPLPDGWTLATVGREPATLVPSYYQAFEVDSEEGGPRIIIDNRALDDPDYPYWEMSQTLQPMDIRGHAGYVTTHDYLANTDPNTPAPNNGIGWTILIWEETPGEWVTMWVANSSIDDAVALARELVAVDGADWPVVCTGSVIACWPIPPASD